MPNPSSVLRVGGPVSSQKLNAGRNRPCGPVLSSYQEEPLPGLSDGLQVTSLAYSRESTGTEGSRNSLIPLPVDTRALEKGRKDKPRSLSNFTASYPWLETSPGPFCPKIFIRYFPQLPGHAVLELCGDVGWL